MNEGKNKSMVVGLGMLTEFLVKHPEVTPYSISCGKFVDTLEEFLSVCHAMGEYEKGEHSDVYVATKYFGPDVELKVYVQKAKVCKYEVPQELRDWT